MSLFLSKKTNKSIVNHTFHNFTQAARARNGVVVVWIGCVFGRFRYGYNSRSMPTWRKITSKPNIISVYCFVLYLQGLSVFLTCLN